MVRLVAATSALVLVVLVHPASASDGVIEINQAIALAGAVNGDLVADPPGFPVRITQPGSYRLTGNLVIPVGQTGIWIVSNIVTLDLGGFVVSGPNSCTGYPTTSCTHPLGDSAIFSDAFLVVVRNGTVLNSQGHGIALHGASSEVDQVRALGSGADGIHIGDAGRVSRSFSGSNLGIGIRFGDGAIVENNEARANGGAGIFLGGLDVRLSTAVVGNRAFDNGAWGIGAGGDETLVSRNVASDNINVFQISGGRSLGDNLCTGTLC